MTTPAYGHEDLKQLLGAYALDGLEPADAEVVERHLQTCQACRSEFAEHLAVASVFSELGVEPPEGVWEKILSQMHGPPAGSHPVLAQTRVDDDRRGRTVGIRVVGAFAAVAAIIILILGIDVVRLDRRGPTSGPSSGQAALQQAARQAIAAPGARRVTLRSSDGTLSVDVVVIADGTGYLVSNDLPALPSGETYQLWGKTGGQLVSFGVLGARPGVVSFRAEAPVVALALTHERAGGAIAPSQQPLVIGALPSP